MLALSGHCYNRLKLWGLGGPLQPDQSDETTVAAFDAFKSGMRAGHEKPYPYSRWDPDTPRWESHLNHDFDLFLLVAADTPSRLQTALRRAKKTLEGCGAQRIEVEEGRKSASLKDLRKKDAKAKVAEHFGYADGIANPIFIQQDLDKLKDDHGDAQYHDPAARLNTILWPESRFSERGKKTKAPVSYGSFLAVMKIEQNVRAFRARALELQQALRLPTADDAEALCVGRRKDGQPLIRSVGRDEDDFNYNDDRQDDFGAKQCPASAHIRRMNRRRPGGGLVIARRGLHYGPAWMDDGLAPPAGGVGLLSLGLSSSLHSFISLMGATQSPKCSHHGGVDALIGQSQEAPVDRPGCDGRQRWWSTKDRNWIDFRMTDFVTPRGGEYFFVPSKHFLDRLAEEEAPKRVKAKRTVGRKR